MKEIPLTRGKAACVDDDLFEALSAYKWYAYRSSRSKNTFYARRALPSVKGKQSWIAMHQAVFILKGLPIPKSIDHKNRDGLDNQFDNLRSATPTQQALNVGRRPNNTSGYIGVTHDKNSGKWLVQVGVSGHRKKLGYYDDPFSAAWIRDQFVESIDPLAVLNNLPDRRIQPDRRCKLVAVACDNRTGRERRTPSGRQQCARNNTSGYIGVSWRNRKQKWEVTICFNGKEKHLGSFTDPFSAAWVREDFIVAAGIKAKLNYLKDRRLQVQEFKGPERRHK